MPAQKGKDLLLKLGDGETPESFSVIGGLRTKSLSLNAQTVDVTHSQSSGGWRELLAGAGVRQASVSGAGVFLNDAAAAEARSVFFSNEARNWRVIVPGFGTIEGAFLIANLDYAGEHDREASMSLALESAGALSFTAEG
ncbi:phage major tail protein, TP901-1 family [Hyphococcus luteus]|uniref:Phage major tail protein, TP901-1 family n=1 Tax=Hyphococcus luteus TaxID=2058213 RepID=A0A2S7K421_9PROT|nr:phage major tail protein, TP901-1 family [Marinicaulis flavus]PQA87242.1 phage major tail protein, TP901-1 family [Marinicaulis flavus]